MKILTFKQRCSIIRNMLLAVSAVVLASCTPKSDTPETDDRAEATANTVPFDISCSAGVRSYFSEAITLLHSFEYVETSKRFDALIEQEPSCAMAYWGAAMSIWHPLWAPPSQAHLQRGAQYLAQTDSLHKSTKETALIDALKLFFSSTDLTTNKIRARAYAQAMEQISADSLEDHEIEIFYALSLLGAADPRDKSYVNQHKSGGLLKELKKQHPLHPGVLHYIIHSYDYPGLAELALEEAKVYAQSAKNSAHAQHMPSHIFTRLGLWEMSISSNHDSTKSAADYTKTAKLPGHYDEGLHSIDYLMYAMLQTARDDEAQALLSRLGDIKKTDTENFKVAFTYAATPARYVLERRAWGEASDLTLLRPDFLWENFGWAESIHRFARGIGAARSSQLGKAKTELARIIELQEGLSDTIMPYLAIEVQVQSDAVKSWIALAEGETEEALRLAALAADLEDSVDKHPVTPGEVLPARELYADMLFETGNATQALTQYRIVLTGSPNRLNALLGAAKSAAKIGEDEASQQYEKIIAEQTRFGNRPNLLPSVLP